MLNYAFVNGNHKLAYISDDTFVFHGTWTPSGTFTPPLDVVNYDNGKWISIVTSLGVPPLGSSSWSQLSLVGTLNPFDPFDIANTALQTANTALETALSIEGTADEAFALATEALNIAIAGTNNSGLSLASAAYALACIGTNVGTNALNAAADAQADADSALSGMNGVMIIAVAGTNLAASAKSGADSAFSIACIGTNVGTNALNAAATAQASANSAISGANSANLIAIAGTNLAQAAFNIACIGTNVGTNAYTLASNGSSLAWEALVIAQAGTNLVYAAPLIKSNGTLNVPDFIASGASHSRGLVPDPGAVAGTSRYLREDSTFVALVKSVTFVIDGGGAAITTGVKGDLEIPFACTINQVTLLADQTGDIVVDIWKDTFANFPPTLADKITASAPPTISSGIKSQDATLTGWNKTVSAGDILRFNVNSASAITRVTLALKVTRT